MDVLAASPADPPPPAQTRETRRQALWLWLWLWLLLYFTTPPLNTIGVVCSGSLAERESCSS